MTKIVKFRSYTTNILHIDDFLIEIYTKMGAHLIKSDNRLMTNFFRALYSIPDIFCVDVRKIFAEWKLRIEKKKKNNALLPANFFM